MSVEIDRPLLGAALNVRSLKDYRDWILEHNRDLEIQDFVLPHALDGDWKSVAEAIRGLLDGYTGRLGLHGPFFSLPIHAYDPLIREVVVKRMMQALDAADYLGATHMVVHSPFTHWDSHNFTDFPDQRAGAIEATHRTMAPVVARAEQLGLMLVIENCDDKDASMRVELARSFSSPAVRVSVDTGHAQYAHVSNGGPPVDHFILLAGDMLEHVHLQDADGHGDRHWAPGQGNILWHTVFAALSRISTKPRLILEMRNHADVRRGADHLVAQGLAL